MVLAVAVAAGLWAVVASRAVLPYLARRWLAQPTWFGLGAALPLAATLAFSHRSQLRFLRRLVVPYRVTAGQLEVLAPAGGPRWLGGPRPPVPGAVD